MKTSIHPQSLTVACASVAASLLLWCNSAAGAPGPTKTYTTNADFDLGALFNVNHDAPNPDQLQLSAQSQPFPLLWVPNTNEDSMSKIDTNTGRELARYKTYFSANPGNANPSRTAIDSQGNCYVANRTFNGRQPDIIKILASGGIDRNGNGVIDTSSDVNGNGVIAGAEMLPMVDSNADGLIQMNEIQDERIAWVVRVGTGNSYGRSLTIDPQGNIWVGLYNSRVYYKLRASDGFVLAGPINVAPATPYGAVVDASGILWGASLGNNLTKLDTNTNTFLANFVQPGQNYGIAYYAGSVYLGYSSPVRRFNTATNVFNDINLGFSALAVSTASNGDLLVHGSSTASPYFASGSYAGATRFRADASIVWSKPNQPGANDANGRGCVPDANGDVWTVNYGTNNVSKYRGSDGAPLGVFPVGNGPYAYSDLTGSTLVQTFGLGTWTAVFDTASATTTNAAISWNASIPSGAILTVASAASNTKATPGDYSSGDFTPVTNNGTAGLTGRYQAVKVSFTAAPLSSLSPVLADLKIKCPDICPSYDINGDGCVDTADQSLLLAAIRARSTNPIYDMNCDNVINLADSRFLATKYTNAGGAPCP